MGLLGRIVTATSAGVSAFRESYFASDPSDQTKVDAWGEWDARRARYAVYWAMVQNDVYRRVRLFSEPYKTQYGLYKHTRGCYNPAARIVGFAQTHICGGSLDPDAGDGSEKPTALPIEGADDAMRKALARLWWDGNLQTKKGVLTLWGATFGDVALRVCDDPTEELVAIDVVHPASIRWLDFTARGDVRAYVLEERRRDPRVQSPTANPNVYATTSQTAVYTEVAELDGVNVRYRTYCNGLPFDWRPGPDGSPMGVKAGAVPEWEAPYGFVPFYPVRHLEIGAPWGQSELEYGRAKIDEVNDLGSKLHDQIRRMVEGAWLMAGVANPTTSPLMPRLASTEQRPEPDRSQVKTLYTPDSGARPWSLVGDLNIAATGAEIRQALDNLEDDYPELRFERLRTGGQISGEALRVARQPAAARIEERRSGYDYALLQAQLAAVAIGGWRGYDGYQGFGLDTYNTGTPPFRIGGRPVFASEPADELAEKAAKYAALKMAKDAGVPMEIAMADLGYSEQDVAEAVRLKDEAAVKAVDLMAKTAPPQGPPQAQNAPPNRTAT